MDPVSLLSWSSEARHGSNQAWQACCFANYYCYYYSTISGYLIAYSLHQIFAVWHTESTDTFKMNKTVLFLWAIKAFIVMWSVLQFTVVDFVSCIMWVKVI